jgi:hypothetical protein
LVNFVWENLFLEFEEKIFKNSLIFFRTLLHSLLQNKRYTRLSADLETIHAYLVKGNQGLSFLSKVKSIIRRRIRPKNRIHSGKMKLP